MGSQSDMTEHAHSLVHVVTDSLWAMGDKEEL